MKRRVLKLVALCATPLLAAAAWIAWPLPQRLAEPRPAASITLVDRHGLPLRTTRTQDGQRGGWLNIEAMDADVIRAFIAAEDQRFYSHHGVDMRALGRALRDDLRGRRIISGASTITMQTARLINGTKRTWRGKVAQLLWAVRLDAQLDKNAILERYLNLVPLGEGTVGVSAAAALYFEASAADLSLGQAALLAGLARRPASDNPIASIQRAGERRAFVLARMRSRGYISEPEVARAQSEPIAPPDATTRFLAPHFTTRVLRALPGGATGVVRTTLDLELQTALESEVRHTVSMLEQRAAGEAAVVVLDNRSGDVLAWVGSPDFFAEKTGQVDMVASPRQPGSALKPFLYGLAFDQGFTAATVLPDVPRAYATTAGAYQPQNYDRRFRGPVRMREALASSYNVPAVELADRLGAGALLRTLQAAGFASLSHSAEFYGLGLALGNGDVSLIELANGYRGIANGGVWQPYRRVIGTHEQVGAGQQRFMSASSAALVLDILSDPIARMPGFGINTPLEFAFPAAAKTGTSRHYTDNWAVATTANFTVAVWVGNFSGRPMQAVSGITGAGPLLHRSVLEVAKRYAPGHLITPEAAGLVPAQVCILSGMAATRACPSMFEWFAPGTEPREADSWQVNGRVTLPPEYAEWSATNVTDVALADSTSSNASARILSPMDGDHYQNVPGMDVRYSTIPLVASGSAEHVRWFVDNEPLTRARWQLRKGAHVIRANWSSGAQDSIRVIVE